MLKQGLLLFLPNEELIWPDKVRIGSPRDTSPVATRVTKVTNSFSSETASPLENIAI